ncbi:MAG: DOMON-like domain-containing protein [Brevundimonas sp.]|nr:MAG: DOMON-like domain-containing protein [Brevundimonas sp.]
MELTPHPRSVAGPIRRISVEATRLGADRLALRYRVEGDIVRLFVPEPAPAARTDELWKRTCFEAFVRVGDSADYYEFNLAPSSRWAAYQFRGYRGEMADADVDTPEIASAADGERFELTALIDVSRLARLDPEADWTLAVSTVIEDVDGQVSHWALAHPSPFPDFHHAQSFVLDLPAPEHP